MTPLELAIELHETIKQVQKELLPEILIPLNWNDIEESQKEGLVRIAELLLGKLDITYKYQQSIYQ